MNKKALVLLFFMCTISCISNTCLGLSDEEYEKLPIRTKQVFLRLSINYKEIKPIYTLEDLQGIDDLNRAYLLMNDIDATSTQEHPFRTLSGRFNEYFIGQDFSILNLNTTKSERVYRDFYTYDEWQVRMEFHNGYLALDYVKPFLFETLKGGNIIDLKIKNKEGKIV
ncbi:MAG: hypothetical protein JSS34_07305 [Proteobacteria bacterium]|nr:hypothetical protein [Pseudomonadota bacterium]